MTSGSSMQAMTQSLLPPIGQVAMSIANTRLSRCIQVIGASRWSGFSPLGSGFGAMCLRYLQFGANTPWQGKPFVRDSGPGDVVAEFLEFVALVGLAEGGCMQREAGLFGEQG